MEISINKSKALKISLILLLFLIVGGILSYLFVFREKELTVYERLYEHCTEQSPGVKECNVFLSDFTKDGNTTCLDLVLPVVDVNKRDIQICIDGDVEWENPYEDYSKVIPVALNIDYTSELFRDDIFEEVKIELLEDEIAYRLLEQMIDENSDNSIYPILQQSVEIAKSGYDIFPYRKYGSGDEQLVLYIFNVGLDSISKKSNEIELVISFDLDGTEYDYDLSVEELRLYDSEDPEVLTLTSEEDLEKHLNLSDRYSFTFSITKKDSEEFVVNKYDELVTDIHNYFNNGKNSNIYLNLENITR